MDRITVPESITNWYFPCRKPNLILKVSGNMVLRGDILKCSPLSSSIVTMIPEVDISEIYHVTECSLQKHLLLLGKWMMTLGRPVASELLKLLFVDITSPDKIARTWLHFLSSLTHSIFFLMFSPTPLPSSNIELFQKAKPLGEMKSSYHWRHLTVTGNF